MVSTLAGLAGSPGSADGPVAEARFNRPLGIAVDAAGNVYVSDTQNQTIRKISTSGTVSTLAGLAGVQGPVDGTGSAARFSTPWGLAVDGAGTVYVADSGNHTIRRIAPSGTVTTLAGLALSPGATDAAAAGDARFRLPRGVTLDGAGRIYVADTGNHTIRTIDLNASPTGTVSTLAGSPGNSGGVDGTGVNARLASPEGIVFAGGTLYVASFGAIRKVTAAGDVTTFAAPTHVDGSNGTPARFTDLSGIAVDAGGRVLVADAGNHRIRAVASDGTVMTFAGLGPGGGFGSTDGPATTATFRNPTGVAVDAPGMVYVADSSNHTIRKITPSGVVSTLAGLAGSPGNSDGSGSAARFSTPTGVAVDTAGTVYVADGGNRAIRKITAAGIVSTLVILNSTTTPEQIAVGLDGTVYVGAKICCVVYTSEILKITPTGTVTTIHSSTTEQLQVGGVAVDAGDTVYFTNTHGTVYERTSSGEFTKLAGRDFHPGSDDGPGPNARFGFPTGIAVDSTGNVYVADNATIRKISPAFVVSTVGGSQAFGSADGIGSTARFYHPRGMAVDAHGRLYIADTSNHTIRIGATGRAFDYDADGRSDLMVYRPANGSWYNSTSSSNFTNGSATQFGLTGDVPSAGRLRRRQPQRPRRLPSRDRDLVHSPVRDRDDDDRCDRGVRQRRRAGARRLRRRRRTDLAIFDPATGVWSVSPSTYGYTNSSASRLGRGQRHPACRATTTAMARPTRPCTVPSTGTWLMRLSSANQHDEPRDGQWGLLRRHPRPRRTTTATARPILAVYPSRQRRVVHPDVDSGYTASVALQWGLSGDMPVPGGLRRRRRADPAVYRPAIGGWYILQSSTSYTTSLFFSWGLDGDIPTPHRHRRQRTNGCGFEPVDLPGRQPVALRRLRR